MYTILRVLSLLRPTTSGNNQNYIGKILYVLPVTAWPGIGIDKLTPSAF